MQLHNCESCPYQKTKNIGQSVFGTAADVKTFLGERFKTWQI